jgi:hypothetical protein
MVGLGTGEDEVVAASEGVAAAAVAGVVSMRAVLSAKRVSRWGKGGFC